MRCPQCNTPDFERVAIVENGKGWYKGFAPCHPETFICQSCGNQRQMIVMDNDSSKFMDPGDIWIAHWESPKEVHQGPDWYEKAKQDDKFEFKPRWGWVGGYGPPVVDFDMSFNMTDEMVEKIKKLMGKGEEK